MMYLVAVVIVLEVWVILGCTGILVHAGYKHWRDYVS